MEKKIGYRAIIDVDGFHDAKAWIYRCVRAGIVKCSSCDSPANHVWWNDAAEWYPECNQHRESGEQWTGSTRWNPSSFSLNVLLHPAKEWLKTLTAEEREGVRIIRYDATDYYELMTDDWSDRTEHYFRGDAQFEGFRLWCRVYPLTNGEFCYELNSGHLYRAGGTSWGYGIRGSWETEALAIAAARADAVKRGLLPENDSVDK